MATTGIVNSRLLVIQVGTVTVSCLTDATFSINRNTRDTTCKDSGGWSNVLAASASWEMSGSALFSFDGTYTYDDLYALITTGASATVKWGSTVTGDTVYSGTGLLTSLEATSPGTDENATYSFTFMGVGAPTSATVS
jgi:predicted secreted protein